MKRKLLVVLVLVVAGLTAFGGKVLATPGNGFVGTTLATATFDAMNLSAHSTPPAPGTRPNPWNLRLRTHGQSDVYIQSNSWPVGADTGWHTHPGPSLIILKHGVLTEWESDRGKCTEHVYDATNGPVSFLDTGGPDHAHILVNDGSVVADGYAVQFVPEGATRRIDVTPAPPNCGPSS